MGKPDSATDTGSVSRANRVHGVDSKVGGCSTNGIHDTNGSQNTYGPYKTYLMDSMDGVDSAIDSNRYNAGGYEPYMEEQDMQE